VGARARDAEELVDKREYKLKRRLRSQTLRHMVTFLITVRSPEVVIRSAIIPPSKYSRHESSIRDVKSRAARADTPASGYVTPAPSIPLAEVPARRAASRSLTKETDRERPP